MTAQVMTVSCIAWVKAARAVSRSRAPIGQRRRTERRAQECRGQRRCGRRSWRWPGRGSRVGVRRGWKGCDRRHCIWRGLRTNSRRAGRPVKSGSTIQSADRVARAKARRGAQELHRERLRFFPQGTVQPGRDAAGRSRNRRHRSRPRTVALTAELSRLQHRRDNYNRALPFPLLGGIANHRLAADKFHVRGIH